MAEKIHGRLENLWSPDFLRNDLICSWRANQTHQWCSPHEASEYFKQSKKSKEVTYGPDDFNYKFNSLGYRSDDFVNDDSFKILYSGCSFTEGVGLPVEHTWAFQLNELIQRNFGIKMKYHNQAIGGNSSDAIFRLMTLLLEYEKFKPDLVIILFPPAARTEMFASDKSDSAIFQYLPNHEPDHLTFEEKVNYNNYKKASIFKNQTLSLIRNMVAVYQLCHAHGIPVKMATWDVFEWMAGPNKPDPILQFRDLLPTFLQDVFIPEKFLRRDASINKFPQTVARDFAHPSPNANYIFASVMYKHLYPELESLIYGKTNSNA